MTDGEGTLEPLREERGPIRTCVGCRTRAPKAELLRLVLPSRSPELSGLGAASELPEVAVDLLGKLPGRGVHVHPSPACLTAAVKRGGLAQALRHAPRTTVSELTTVVRDAHRERALGLFGLARRARALAVGTEAVREAMGTVALLVIASDAEARPEELLAEGERLGGHAVVLSCGPSEETPAGQPRFGTKGALGSMFGRDEVAVLGILDRGIADHVREALGIAAALTVSDRTEA